MIAFAGAVLLVGILAGPLLDRIAVASLGEPRIDGEDSRGVRSWIVTGLIAGVSGAIAVLLVPEPRLAPAWIALAFVGALITRTDLARHRIPDVLNAVALASGAILLLLPGDLGAYGRGWLAAAAVTVVFLALALIGASGLGMGDVKLAPALGIYLGFLGWPAVLVGVFAGFLAGALAGLAVVARDAVARRPLGGALRRALPFGPFLLVGTLVGLAWS